MLSSITVSMLNFVNEMIAFGYVGDVLVLRRYVIKYLGVNMMLNNFRIVQRNKKNSVKMLTISDLGKGNKYIQCSTLSAFLYV